MVLFAEDGEQDCADFIKQSKSWPHGKFLFLVNATRKNKDIKNKGKILVHNFYLKFKYLSKRLT